MQYWRNGEGLGARHNGPVPGQASFFFTLGALPSAQTPQKPATKKVSAHRANELTLGGLRPGRDLATRGIKRSSLAWTLARRFESLVRGRRRGPWETAALCRPDRGEPGTGLTWERRGTGGCVIWLAGFEES